MRRISVALLCGSLGIATAQVAHWRIGDDAPKFTIHEIDGRLQTLKTLENEGNFFLYFGKRGDPVDDAMRPYINRMVTTYVPGRAKWYAVTDIKPEAARAWNAEAQLPYHVLLDQGGVVRRLFQVDNAPTIIEVGVDGKILNYWMGFSGDGLKKLNREVARINRMKVKNMDFTRTPSVTQFGQPW